MEEYKTSVMKKQLLIAAIAGVGMISLNSCSQQITSGASATNGQPVVNSNSSYTSGNNGEQQGSNTQNTITIQSTQENTVPATRKMN
jgi:hypothetical protein